MGDRAVERFGVYTAADGAYNNKTCGRYTWARRGRTRNKDKREFGPWPLMKIDGFRLDGGGKKRRTGLRTGRTTVRAGLQRHEGRRRHAADKISGLFCPYTQFVLSQLFFLFFYWWDDAQILRAPRIRCRPNGVGSGQKYFFIKIKITRLNCP